MARGESYGEFSDDPDTETAAATVIQDDDLELFDESDHGDAEGYRDHSHDDEHNVFRHDDEDEEVPIGLNRQQSRKC